VSPLFLKLNLKNQRVIHVYNPPACFEPQLAALGDVKIVRDAKKPSAVEFALGFATQQTELDRLSRLLAGGCAGDALLWFAYPKGTSKRFTCDFNRDSGFATLRGAGFDSVRQVAIDEDWSALRFRRVEYIKA
jgi:hypothetical protein